MGNPEIIYDEKNEYVRVKLLEHIESKGTKQNFFAKKCKLSSCSISLFLNKKRMLTDMHLELLLSLVKS